MGLDFDLKNFMEDMRACKPPYKCPYPDCAKVYKTYPGIQSHIQQHLDKLLAADDDPNNTESSKDCAPAVPFFGSPLKESLVFDELQKRFEFEAEGNIHKFGVYDALPVGITTKKQPKVTSSPSSSFSLF